MADKRKKNDDILDGVEMFSSTKVTSKEARKRRKKAEQGQYDALKNFNIAQKKYLVIGLFAISIILAFLLSFMVVFEKNVQMIAPVIGVIVLEVAIGFLLDHNPIWLHALVAIANLVVGIIFQQVAFMVFMMLVYIVGIVTLEAIQRLNNRMALQRKKQMRHE